MCIPCSSTDGKEERKFDVAMILCVWDRERAKKDERVQQRPEWMCGFAFPACLTVLPNEQSQTFRYHLKSFIKLDYSNTKWTNIRLDAIFPMWENGYTTVWDEMRWRWRCDRVKMRENETKKNWLFFALFERKKQPIADNDIEMKTLKTRAHFISHWILFVNVHTYIVMNMNIEPVTTTVTTTHSHVWQHYIHSWVCVFNLMKMLFSFSNDKPVFDGTMKVRMTRDGGKNKKGS